AAGVRDEAEIAPSKAARSERQQAELVPISLNTSGAAPSEATMVMTVPDCVLPDDRMHQSNPELDAVRQLNARGIDAGPSCQEGNIILRHGSVLFAPDKKMVVNTTAGQIVLGPGSVVLVAATDSCVAVYDLHDRRMDDVSVTTGTKQIVLAPGQ